MAHMQYITKCNENFYRDLRNFADDKTVLTNPHKGWYLHFIDNGIQRIKYRDDIKGPEDILNVPGMPFLYLRIDWGDIEKNEGIFDWSYVDDIIEKYGSKGYKFMFRFCTYEGSSIEATPKWVFDKGAKYNLITKTRDENIIECFEPIYDDPIYKKYLNIFIGECARKFDGKDFVETVDIGTFGTWGEGHTWQGSRQTYPLETLKWHIDVHVKHFKRTRLVVNDDMIRHTYGMGDNSQCGFLAEYCKGFNMGIRDDSINVTSYADRMGYDTICSPDLFKLFNEASPVDLEFEHYNSEHFFGGFRHIEALRNTGATYAGFHGHITEWYKEQENIHKYLANRLGYWYFINGFSLVPLMSGSSPVLSLNVENKGFSRAYHPYTFKVVLEDANGTKTTVFSGDAGNESWLPGKALDCRLKLDLEGIEAGEYDLLVGLFEGDTPIKLAIDQSRCRDGYYLLDKVTVE